LLALLHELLDDRRRGLAFLGAGMLLLVLMCGLRPVRGLQVLLLRNRTLAGARTVDEVDHPAPLVVLAVQLVPPLGAIAHVPDLARNRHVRA